MDPKNIRYKSTHYIAGYGEICIIEFLEPPSLSLTLLAFTYRCNFKIGMQNTVVFLSPRYAVRDSFVFGAKILWAYNLRQ